MVDVEKEMMKEIMADYHSGDPRKVASAKEQILNKAQRLITFMIKKYFPTYIPRYYDELYQECMVALYDAIPKFNPERATLSTYLTKPLHRAMSAYIHSLTNRSNSYYGKQMDDVRHAIHVLETEGKRTTESNIALYTNYSLRQVHDILFRLTYIDEVSYDGTDDEDSQSKQDHLEAKMTSYVKNPETEYIEGQATLLLNTALTKLNPTDLKILMTEFDSSETGEASYASTAKKLGLPVSKVKRSITRSLRILRNDDGLKDWFEYQNNDYNSVDGDLVGLGLSDEQLNDYEEMDNDIMVSIGISPEEPTSKARTPKKRISFSVTIDGDFSDSIILKVQGNGQIKKEYV